MASVVKVALIAFNGLFLLAGCFLAYLGKMMLSHSPAVDEAIMVNMKGRAILILLLGGCVLALALFGIYCAFCESAPLLYIYGGLLFVVMLATIGSIYMDQLLKAELKSALEATINNGGNNFTIDKALARPLQFAQKLFECCGWDGPDDYKHILAGGRVPVSCCGKMTFQEKGKAQETCKFKKIVFKRGCAKATLITIYTALIKYTCLCTVFIQLILLFGGCFLVYTVRNKDDYSVSY